MFLSGVFSPRFCLSVSYPKMDARSYNMIMPEKKIDGYCVYNHNIKSGNYEAIGKKIANPNRLMLK